MRSTTVTTVTQESFALHRMWLIAQGGSEHTARAYNSDLRLWTEDCPTVLGQELTATELEAMAWLNMGRKVWKPKTTQRRRTALRSYARYLGEPEYLGTYRAPTAAPGYAHPITGGIDAVQQMIDVAVEPHHKALIALCGLCGCRVNEAVTVTTDDLNLVHFMLTIHGKGAKDRDVPISARALPWLMIAYGRAVAGGYKPLVPMAERTARATITRIGERAGLGQVASHDLRMTFGTAAYAKTKDLRAVQDLLGHSSSKTTELYTGISTTAMRAAADL